MAGAIKGCTGQEPFVVGKPSPCAPPPHLDFTRPLSLNLDFTSPLPRLV